ncbi:MAG: hypothetical protein ACI33S_00640 [Bacilli bacterium]
MKLTLLDEMDREYLSRCKVTHMALLSGCNYCKNDRNYYGHYYLYGPLISNGMAYFNFNYGKMFTSKNISIFGIRPVIENIENFDEIIKNKYLNEVEYGLYPDSLPSFEVRDKLNILKSEGKLSVVGHNSFSDIYEYNGEFYNQIKSKESCSIEHDDEIETIEENQLVWVKLNPIKWIVDSNNKRLISKDIIMSGIEYDNKKDRIVNFENTNMYRYLNEVMLKDLMISINKSEKKSEESHIYNLNQESLSENDVIKSLILSGVPVSLIGDANKEKEDILRSIDPDYISLKTVNFDISMMEEFKNKCVKQPNKIHILKVSEELEMYYGHFINQYLNQINDYMSGVNNFAIVSTFSKDVNYDNFIKFKVKPYIPNIFDNLIRKDIHPLIYSLILYLGEDRINAITTQEKLIQASSVLKTTGNIKILNYILSKELVDILVQLYQERIITIDDVINRSYNSDIFEMNKEKKALLIPYLAQVDEENIEVVRNFVISLDLSLLNIFDYLWCKDNLERKKIIEDLGKTNNMVLSKGV